MLELRLQRSGDILEVQLEAYTATLPLLDVAVNETTWQHIFEDAVVYGRDLFDRTFCTDQVRSLLAELPAQERLALVADDPILAAIPWEYLRDTNGKLLAGRCAFYAAFLQSSVAPLSRLPTHSTSSPCRSRRLMSRARSTPHRAERGSLRCAVARIKCRGGGHAGAACAGRAGKSF